MKDTKIEIAMIKSIIIVLLCMAYGCVSKDSMPSSIKQTQIMTMKTTTGKILPLGILVNGKKEGMWIDYDTDGTMLWAVNYSVGIDSGAFVIFNGEGGIRIKGTCYKNEPIDSLTRYYSNGNVLSTWKQNSKEDFRQVYYKKNGQLDTIVTYQLDSTLKIPKQSLFDKNNDYLDYLHE